MEPNDLDLGELVSQLASEILAAVNGGGDLESWATERLDGLIHGTALDKACTLVAEQFLTSDPPQTGYWDHLLVTLALHSTRTKQRHSFSACTAVLRHLGDMLSEERPKQFNSPMLTTMASAMTMVLATQYRLKQDIEDTMLRLCEQFPEVLPEIADHCQAIWKRHGQMSGRRGLFLWDIRKQEWRLTQDFASYAR